MKTSIEDIEHFLALQPCPYFQDGRDALSEHVRFKSSIDREHATSLIQQGWRRYGSDLYRMRCEGCRLCIPIRIDASEITISDSMKRILRLNKDLVIIPCKPSFSEEHLILWRAYSLQKHLTSPEDLDVDHFKGLSSPWSMIFEYRRGGPEGELLAISHIDPVPDGFSSVYFSFSPSAKKRSLGYFSVLTEACIAQMYSQSETSSLPLASGESIFEYYFRPRVAARRAFYYMGFWVPGAVKMDYKSRFRPFSLLLTDENDNIPLHWFTFNTKAEAIRLLRAAHWPGM